MRRTTSGALLTEAAPTLEISDDGCQSDQNVKVTKAEEQRNSRFIFRVRVRTTMGQTDFPISVQDQGSSALNETVALRSTLAFVEDLAASVRHRLGLA